MGYFSSGLAWESLLTSFLQLLLGGGACLAGLVDCRASLLLLMDRGVVALRCLDTASAPPMNHIGMSSAPAPREVGRRELMLDR